MATLTINDNPTISDSIVFSLETPDYQGCFSANPYKVNKLVIYYVERDFNSGNLSTYINKEYEQTNLKAAKEAEVIACTYPTEDNILNAKKLRAIAESNSVSSPFNFTQANPVLVLGNDEFPAWLSTDLDNAFLELSDDTGIFNYTWNPLGMREGDYFICWTWTPLIAGDSLSSHLKFSLKSDTQLTTSIPSHFTNPEKYKTLLERYTPEMFKMVISNGDRTPDVLEKFNLAIADGFNLLEDLANQMVDLQDSNSIHESLIPYLSNLFDLKLKTSDPTRWRGQIKRAIPLFKSKGTKKSLKEALDHAAITLTKLSQLWEITSSYTWQESFKFKDDLSFVLNKVALDVDYDNFELWIRPNDSDEWIALSADYVEFETSEGVTTMTWVGNTLSIAPIDLIEDDEIRVLYKYNEIPDPSAQTIEEYIRSLPLMDQREERDQIYPLKNWNVRVIPEDDPLFPIIIPNRHPYHEFLVYGKVRTEFPYSENIYNMEEYNGSNRNSKLPCDIDRDFIDPCSACISSSYNVDLEIENLSDDRIFEAKEVIREFSPFHSILHTLNFTGGVSEYVESPIEEIEVLISIEGNEFVIGGEGQTYFNRIMKLVETNGIGRGDLADSELITTESGIAYNDYIVVFSPGNKLDRLGMALDGSAKMHILSPSSLAGEFTLFNPVNNTVEIDLSSGQPDPVTEPIDDCNTFFANDNTLNTCAFAYDINNLVLDGTLCNITQDNLFYFKDETNDLSTFSIKSIFDVNQGLVDNPWKILIPTYSMTAYEIHDILPDGMIILINHGGLPSSTTSISYTLQNELGASQLVATTGEIITTNRGRVTALSSTVLPISNIVKLDNTFYFKVNSDQYLIDGFVPDTDDQFYIKNYNDGDINSANLRVDKKIVTEGVGYLSHRGLKIQLPGNLESSLGIQNGTNSLVVSDDGVENDGFKENFIIVINGENYFIGEIDGNNPSGFTTISLFGSNHYWKTLDAGGTSVSVSIYQYFKNGATIEGQQYDLPQHTFSILDRSGSNIISGVDNDTQEVTSLSTNGNETLEVIRQTESVSYVIEYDDGTIEEGTI